MEIYLITNNATGKKYVGMTTRGYILRFEEHLRQARSDRYKIGLHGAIKKYGPNSFSVDLIDTASSMLELEEKEIFFIEKFNTITPNGYNLKSGGFEGYYSDVVLQVMSKKATGRVVSEETRKKISKLHKGRPRTKRQIDAIRNRSIGNNYCLGRKLTEEHKKKISDGNTGKVKTEKEKQLLSEMNSGNNHPQSDKAIYTFYNNEYGFFVGTRSDFFDQFNFRLSHLFGKSKRKYYKGWCLHDAK
jgi:group I intron endonuclease